MVINITTSLYVPYWIDWFSEPTPVLDSERKDFGRMAQATAERREHWQVGYFFSIGASSCGGTEDVEAATGSRSEHVGRLNEMARGQWTAHTKDCQGELLALLRAAGGQATMSELYRRGAWGIRTSTIKALLRKGQITCAGDVWREKLVIAKHDN